jgi:hypothetical protein
MIDQKKEPAFPQAHSTPQGLSPHPEIEKSQTEISLCSDVSILANDRRIVSIVLSNNGCQKSIDWFDNTLAQQRQARWVHPWQNLIVDVFETSDGKIRISMHHLRMWQSPQDHLMPRFAKTIAFAIAAAGANVRYKQLALSKYEKQNNRWDAGEEE